MSALRVLLLRSRLPRLTHLRNEFHILAYHMISDAPNGFFPEISLRNFVRQIQFLRSNYNVLPLEEIIGRLSRQESVRNCVAVTFDDGFRDNYEKAYPVLKKYGVPATIFLTTGFIEKGETPWFIKLRSVFMRTPKSRVDIDLGKQTVPLSLRTAAEKRAASDTVMHYLRTCPDRERLTILPTLPLLLGVDPSSTLEPQMLTWAQVNEMSQNGIQFGAHTVTHPVLSQVDAEVLQKEIADSKTMIEERTGRAVKSFAYPFGRTTHYPREAPALLKQLGFACAVTTEPGTNGLHAAPYELRRSLPWEVRWLEA